MLFTKLHISLNQDLAYLIKKHNKYWCKKYFFQDDEINYCAFLASILRVAWGTNLKRSLEISLPVTLHIPYVLFSILIKALFKFLINFACLSANLIFSSFERVEAKYVGSYTHGVKIAVLVGLNKNTDNVDVLAKDLAMQVASMGATTLSYKDFDPEFVANETEARIAAIEKDNIELGRLGKTLKNVPQYISMSQLTDEVLEHAKSEIESQLQAEGKPEQIWEKIVPGKLERFISDNTTLDQEQCLLDQKFIKDEDKTVDSYIKSYGDIEVSSFKRVSLG